MATYVVQPEVRTILEPAVGEGAFLRAMDDVASAKGLKPQIVGYELFPEVLNQARENGISSSLLSTVKIHDFMSEAQVSNFDAIIANPPYIRHHRLGAEQKLALQTLAKELTGLQIDGRAGLHIYFLVKALSQLNPGGRLAFIMPADTVEGVFAPSLWKWIAANYAIDAVVTFQPGATPFPNVDTNALVFLIRRAATSRELMWVECRKAESEALQDWLDGSMCEVDNEYLLAIRRALPEALATGFSRPPMESDDGSHIRLGELCAVMRGIASGANEYFLFTKARISLSGIPDRYFVRTIARTRDVPGPLVDEQLLDHLDLKGRPTFLLSLQDTPQDSLPKSVQDYIRHGEQIGLSDQVLLSTRRPWYKMESRRTPPLLFAYLGRRNTRFILNEASVVPLTGFLCVYPKHVSSLEETLRLFRALQDPRALTNLRLVGKSYGDGALKVEPRALERLQIPYEVADEYGLIPRRQPVNLGLGI